MSYYGKKAQPRSANSNKSTVAELRKGKYIADRKHRNKYLDDYIQDDYLKEDYTRNDYIKEDYLTSAQPSGRDIDTIPTDRLVDYTYTEIRTDYNKATQEFASERQYRYRTTRNKKDTIRNEYNLKSRNNTQLYDNSGNKSSGNNASGYIGSAKEISDALTPEMLKAKHYSAQKNQQRYQDIQNNEDWKSDPANLASTSVKSFGQKVAQTWVAVGKLIMRINWLAGLIYIAVTMLLLAIGLLLIILCIPTGAKLPVWAYSSMPSIKLLMTDYEYYWDAAVYEVGNQIENNNSISIPVDPSDENIKIGNELSGAKYINWRQVLAVYYAGMQTKENEKRIPDDDLIEFSSKDKALNLVKPSVKSYFNTVFWNMHNVMPVKDFTYNDTALKSYVSNSKINSYGFTICYKPDLNVVMSRLGFNQEQQALVLCYLTEDYDEYFDDIIKGRYIGASTAVAQFAANEIGNVGTKYNKWRGTAQGTSWCQIFVEYVLWNSGNYKLTSGQSGVTSAYKFYKEQPKIAQIHVVEGKSKDNLGTTPQPGWLVVFEWGDHDKYRDHIGIVESYDASTGIVTTIEGNTWTGTRQANSRTKVCRLHRRITSSTKGHHIYAFIELAYPKAKQNASARNISKATNRKKEAARYAKICKSASAFLNNNPEVLGAMQYSVKYITAGIPEWFITETNPDTHYRAITAIINVYAGNHGKPKAQWKHPSEISLGIKNYDKSPYILDTSYYNLLANYYKRKIR